SIVESDLCPGDKITAGETAVAHQAFLDLATAQASELRGFYQDTTARVITSEIVNGYMQYPVDMDCTGKLSPPCGFITMYGGAKNNTTQDALAARINFDTDNVSPSYETYIPNTANGDIVGHGFPL